MPSLADPGTTVSAYFTDAEEPISFFDEVGNPEAYLPCGMSFDALSVEKSSEVKSLNVRLDNVSREFCTLANQVDLIGVEVQFLRATRDSLFSPDCAQAIIVGHINSWTISETEIEVEVIVPMSLEQKVPRRLFWPLCGWEFGGAECGFTGGTTGMDLAKVANVISGGSYIFNPAINAFNNNTGDSWISSQTGTGISGVAYIGQNGLPRPVGKIRLFTYSNPAQNISSLKVQFKDDGGAWIDIATWTISPTENVWNEFTVPAYTPTTTTHSVRLLANANLAANVAWRVCEIEMLIFPTNCGHTVTDCTVYGNKARYGGFPHLLKCRDPRKVWVKTSS